MAGFVSYLVVGTLFAFGIATAPFLSFPVPISSSTLSSSSISAHFMLKDDPQVKSALDSANKASGKMMERVKSIKMPGGIPGFGGTTPAVVPGQGGENTDPKAK